ncbi:hypothetical protein F4779DRAFT_637953 [Xylariaceae sp. FL0662B]|nr:hypothetical protein F4779DRAFT_637953 [Xylariaceae sp. FL0662B]
MKTSASLILASILTRGALAAPSTLPLDFTKRQGCGQPTANAVKTAISTWLSDVETVNAFLDQSPSTPGFGTLARSTKTTAENEPVQLGVLASICELNSADSQYAKAVLLLEEIFGNVPAQLQTIADNPNNGAAVRTALQVIGNTRCCNVLPALDVIWVQAAADFALVGSVDTTVPRPAQCGNIQC